MAGPIRKSGLEPIHSSGRALGFDLLDFWRWSGSDLLSNALRGRFAEYLVARALGIATDGVRNEWDSYDLITSIGARIEVKSSAYVQSWAQTKPSAISFGIQPTFAQDGGQILTSGPRARQAQYYVFALLHHRERASIDALDVAHWEFYVLSAAILNERCPAQKTISLSALLKLGPKKASYDQLAALF